MTYDPRDWMTEQQLGPEDPRVQARDWRRDWHGTGDHMNKLAFRSLLVTYNRDAAMFDQRELYAWAEKDDIRWGANARRFTSDVFRHPEYKDRIVKHDPRSVFYPKEKAS